MNEVFLRKARDGKNFRRFLILLIAVDVISRRVQNSQSAQNYAECLLIYFEMVPDPYPAFEEVKRLLSDFLGCVNNLELLEPFCQEYASNFPKGQKNYEPRSLRHLARCQAKKTVLKYGSLPVVVSKLALPNEVKDYILCKDV